MRLHKREWIIAIVAIILTGLVSIPTGMAVADRIPGGGATDQCADLYEKGSAEYNGCTFYMVEPDTNLEVVSVLGDGSEQSTPQAEIRPPTTFCVNPDGTSTAKADDKSCSRKITCVWDGRSGKYLCQDERGRQANPPRSVCRQNPDFACDTKGLSSPLPTRAADAAPRERAEPEPVTDPAQEPAQDPAQSPGQDSAPPTGEPLAATAPSEGPTGAPSASPSASASPRPTASPSPSPSRVPLPEPGDVIGEALKEADALGLRIWLETDLVASWQAGRAQLKAAAARLAKHAARPGVFGVKIAYDLGMRGGFTKPSQVRKFVADTSLELRAVLPAGQQIAVDVVIPELGCGTNKPCIQAMRTKYPLLTLANVEQYVLTGAVDAVNVSGGLFTSLYQQWKISADRATKAHWIGLRTRNWATRVPGLYIGAREIGLAHAGNTSKVGRDAAEAAVKAKVDLPLRNGVQHVVLWTWRQTWDGNTWRLMNGGIERNAVWNSLRARKALRAVGVSFNPGEVENGIADDLKAIADVASQVYIYTP
ncbi:hypothetical protein SAMN05421505_13223 [Sinosporangium album]|uniref:Uncharacterized protein n=1 Tax=Sinosporangium album TaxID=504805 RepID=A0A1G8HGK7_9ACTN|nr:hypothetical protein [Sinosporangium album]SDI05788.1 hypothetical protein SAMN05421505_13223 [Sinosporangium album]